MIWEVVGPAVGTDTQPARPVAAMQQAKTVACTRCKEFNEWIHSYRRRRNRADRIDLDELSYPLGIGPTANLLVWCAGQARNQTGDAYRQSRATIAERFGNVNGINRLPEIGGYRSAQAPAAAHQ